MSGEAFGVEIVQDGNSLRNTLEDVREPGNLAFVFCGREFESFGLRINIKVSWAGTAVHTTI